MNPKKLNIVIVEDELIVAESIAMVLEELGHTVTGRFRTAEEAYQSMMESKPDFAILDIHLHGARSGIWLAKMVRQEMHIPFIFLSAHGDKATVKEAVSERPYGYLMKPFEKMDMYTAIEVALTNFNNSLLAEADNGGGGKQDGITDGIFIKHKHLLQKVKFENMLYIQADGNYLLIFTPEQRFSTKGSMSDFEGKLPDNFIRVHRSFLVNADKVEGINPKALYVDGKEIPISGSYRNELMEKLMN